MSEEEIKQIELKEDEYEIFFTQIKRDFTKELISISNEAIQQNRLEKDAAKIIV